MTLESRTMTLESQRGLIERYSPDIKQAESVLDNLGTLDSEQSLEEKRLVRKLDQRILPIACLLYLFACWLFLLSLIDYLFILRLHRLGSLKFGQCTFTRFTGRCSRR